MLLQVHTKLEPELLHQAFDQLLRHHDALRTRFTQEDGLWQANVAPFDTEDVFAIQDLHTHSPEEQTTAIERVCSETQTQLNLSAGPLLRAVWFDLGPEQPARLLIVVHHLVVDGVSWRILLEDLYQAYGQLQQTGRVTFPPKTTSLPQWLGRLQEYAQDERLLQQKEFWLQQAERATAMHHSMGRDADGDNTVSSAETVVWELDEERTEALLRRVPSAYHTQINEVLLAALTQAYHDWSGASALLVDVEGHGREELFDDIDVSRTVGWFTSLFPVLLQGEPGRVSARSTETPRADATWLTGDPGDLLKSIKEQWRAVPDRGIGYGILRYYGDDATQAALANAPQADISFNYLGQIAAQSEMAGLFSGAEESAGLDQSPTGTTALRARHYRRHRRGPIADELGIRSRATSARGHSAFC